MNQKPSANEQLAQMLDSATPEMLQAAIKTLRALRKLEDDAPAAGRAIDKVIDAIVAHK